MAVTRKILDVIDPQRIYVSHVLNRDRCVPRDTELFIKDLRIIKDRSLEKMVIVDSDVFSFSGQLENGIYIPPFETEKNDTELLTIMEFLISLKNVADVRPIVKKFAGIVRAFKMYSKTQTISTAYEEEQIVEEEYSASEIGTEYE